MGREGKVVYTLKGASGKSYKFDTYTKDTKFDDISAVYVFTKRFYEKKEFYQTPLYIGESSELGTRIENHEKWPCVNSYGCTHISVMQISGEKERLAAETDLRQENQTSCNDQ